MEEINKSILRFLQFPIEEYMKKSRRANTYIDAPTDAIVFAKPTSTYFSPPYNAVRASPRLDKENIILTDEEKNIMENNDIIITKLENMSSNRRFGILIILISVSLKRVNGIKNAYNQTTN